MKEERKGRENWKEKGSEEKQMSWDKKENKRNRKERRRGKEKGSKEK